MENVHAFPIPDQVPELRIALRPGPAMPYVVPEDVVHQQTMRTGHQSRYPMPASMKWKIREENAPRMPESLAVYWLSDPVMTSIG
jgi:hypothetical protein